MKKLSIVYLMLCVLFSLIAAPGFAQEEEGMGETGTDPRDFAAKFMPYYRYTELDNELEQHEVVMFGLIPLNKLFAMTYEIPLAKEIDISETGECPDGADCDVMGVGDMNLRFFHKLPGVNFIGMEWMIGAEFVFPTATDDAFGGEQFLVKPMLVNVRDLGFWPAPGAFMAWMHFYSFDAFGDDDLDDVSMYIGRYFFMLPLHPSGIYTLPEVQFIYDFEEDHSSVWVGPEFGKILAEGQILYAKPGWGIDPDPEDRKFSFEVGYRHFF